MTPHISHTYKNEIQSTSHNPTALCRLQNQCESVHPLRVSQTDATFIQNRNKYHKSPKYAAMHLNAKLQVNTPFVHTRRQQPQHSHELATNAAATLAAAMLFHTTLFDDRPVTSVKAARHMLTPSPCHASS